MDVGIGRCQRCGEGYWLPYAPGGECCEEHARAYPLGICSPCKKLLHESAGEGE